MSEHTNRREFLERLGVGAAGIMAAGYTATARGYAVNETIRVGCIGTGGRCQQLMNALGKVAGTQIVAVCDVWDVHLAKGQELAGGKAFATKDYRELLARKDVDAIIIGAPDHWHVPLTIDACAAGKDVYVEKPLTHALDEGARVVEAQEKYRRVVQIGTQQRSMPQFQEGFEIVRSGQLGKIWKVHLTWNRNTGRHRRNKLGVDPASVDWRQFLGSAPQQPFDEYRFRNWRWFWDFGGGLLTDLMVHHIDIANWYLDLGYPARATAVGDHFLAKDLWQTPDTIQALYQYPQQQVQLSFEGTFSNARNAAMLEFMGSEATLYLDRGRYELHPEPGRKLEYREHVIGQGPRGADYYETPPGEVLHLANWAECIRSRGVLNAPVEAGVRAVLAAHLGNQAYRSGEVVEWTG
jgi:predicted dehydrogenase